MQGHQCMDRFDHPSGRDFERSCLIPSSGRVFALGVGRCGVSILRRRSPGAAHPFNPAREARDWEGAGVYRNELFPDHMSGGPGGTRPNPSEPLVPRIQKARWTRSAGTCSQVTDPTGCCPPARVREERQSDRVCRGFQTSGSLFQSVQTDHGLFAAALPQTTRQPGRTPMRSEVNFGHERVISDRSFALKATRDLTTMSPSTHHRGGEPSRKASR